MPRDKQAEKALVAAKTAQVKNCQWWRASEAGKKPHEMLSALVSTIRNDQSERYQAYKNWAKAAGQDMSAITGELQPAIDDTLTINELQNTIETLHAQIFKNKVVPAPCPTESDYEQFFRAMAFSRWIEGVLDDTRVFYDVVPQVGMAALIFGTGAVKVYPKMTQSGDSQKAQGKIVCEAVSPMFLYVDRLEARHGKPRSMHQKMHVDRWVALEKWGDTPEKQLAIIDAKQYDGEDFDLADLGDGDQITVWHSWHLGTEAGDGKEVIWIKDCTLDEGDYEEQTFPFVFLKFGTPIAGFWGMSAVQRLLPAQKSFDKLTDRIDQAHDLLGIPRIIKRPGTVKTTQLDDVPGTIIEVENPTDLKEWNPVPITPDAYRERDSLPNRMRGSIGISGFEAQLQLPQQLREASGAALERWVDAGNARHAMFHGQYEEFMMQLTWAILRVAAALEKEGVDVVAKAPGRMRSTVEMLKFSEVKIDFQTLKLRVMPVNQLPRTFAGRVKELGALRDRGDITQKTYLRLLEIPDLESEIDNYVSDEDIIRKNLDYMVRTGKYLSPLPYDNHDLIVKLAARKIHEVRIRIEDEEECNDVVALLVQYIEDSIALKNGIGQPEGALPGVPGGPNLGPAPDPNAAFAPPGPPVPPPGAVPPPGPGIPNGTPPPAGAPPPMLPQPPM